MTQGSPWSTSSWPGPRPSAGEVVLRERRDPDSPTVVELRVNGAYVMDTLETVSEQGLATTALAQVDDPREVLVGGLGLGFTAREVLSDHRVERLVVVEIEEALVGWMRDGTVPHGPAYLADERLTVVAADIKQAISEATPASYDLVLLDVDNGPDFLVYDDNSAVYRAGFLREVAGALRPGGAVAVWSAAESRRPAQRAGRGVRERDADPVRRAAAGPRRAVLALPRPTLGPTARRVASGHGRLPHRARQHGRGRGPRGRTVAGPDPARRAELPDQRRPSSRTSTSRRWRGSRPPPRRSTPTWA